MVRATDVFSDQSISQPFFSENLFEGGKKALVGRYVRTFLYVTILEKIERFEC